MADVDRLGAAVVADIAAGMPLREWPFADVADVFLVAAVGEMLSPDAAFALAVSYLLHLVEQGDRAETTVEKAASIVGRFVKYVERVYDIADVREIEQRHVLAFIDAPMLGAELRSASGRTKENRRWALDLVFRTLRGLDLYVGDPFLDASRNVRPSTDFRPLLDAEMERCRKHAPRGLHDTLAPVRVALAEAMAASSEIPEVLVADYDRANARVWLNGSPKRLQGRWAPLLPHEVDVVEQRIAALDHPPPDTPIAYDGKGGASRREAAASTALRAVLNRAGLTRRSHPSVRPSSIRAWGARRLFDETGDLEKVAHRLGLRQLDDARRTIGVAQPEPDVPPPHRRPR